MNIIHQNYLDELWRNAWKPTPRIDPHLWLENHVEAIPYSPKPGRYKSSASPMHREIMREYAKRTTRLISVLKPIQGAGTLAAEGLLDWSVINNTGPTLWITKDDKKARNECLTRLQPLFKNTDLVRDLLPPKHEMRQDFIQFLNGMPLWVVGAIIDNLQSLSIQNIFIDEWWQFRANNIIQHAMGRTTAFSWNSKVMMVSQAGEAEQEGHQIHNNSDCREEFFKCPHCKQSYQWTFETLGCYKEGQTDNDGKPRLSLDCAKRKDGSYDYNEIKASAVFMCPHCYHIWKDSERSLKQCNAQTFFQATNPNAEKGHIGIHYECNSQGVWGERLVQYAKSQEAIKSGNFELYKQFKQQRRAIAWSDDTEDFVIDLETDDYLLGADWEDEAVIVAGHGIMNRDEFAAFNEKRIKAGKKPLTSIRFRIIGVDRQMDHMFAVCASISKDGRIRIFKRKGGKGEKGVHDWPDLERIAEECEVDPQFVFVDAGFDTYETYSKCFEYGFNALMGSDRDIFDHKVKAKNGNQVIVKTTKKIYSPNYKPPIDSRNHARAFYWSNLFIKNILFSLLETKQIKLPRNIGQVFKNHLGSEHKVKEIKEKGRVKKLKKERYVQIGKRPNHYLDCLAEIIVALVMMGIIRFDIDFHDDDDEAKIQVDE